MQNIRQTIGPKSPKVKQTMGTNSQTNDRPPKVTQTKKTQINKKVTDNRPKNWRRPTNVLPSLPSWLSLSLPLLSSLCIKSSDMLFVFMLLRGHRSARVGLMPNRVGTLSRSMRRWSMCLWTKCRACSQCWNSQFFVLCTYLTCMNGPANQTCMQVPSLLFTVVHLYIDEHIQINRHWTN